MDTGSPERLYHDPPQFRDVILELAASMQNSDFDTTLLLAEEKAANYYFHHRFLVSQAVDVLFRSDDPNVWEHGLKYMSWDAENFPDAEVAGMIAKEAKEVAQDEVSREFAKRYFEIPLIHLRALAKAENFVPDRAYVGLLNVVTDHISLAGFQEMFRDVIIEFKDLVLSAANGDRPGWEYLNFRAYSLELALTNIAYVLHDSEPETARSVRELITIYRISEYHNVYSDKL